MANCMIGFPNRVDTSALSGGSWLSSLPLDQFKNRTLGRVARSTDTALASTQLVLDQTAPRAAQVFSLVNHNISTTGRYRLRGSNDLTFATALFDSGWSDVWPIVYPYPVLEWENDSWWSGRYSEEDIAGYTATLVILLPTAIGARYWWLEIDDQTNNSGYVQAGRIFIGPVWQPSKNASFGLGANLETKTNVQEALGGSEFFDYRKPYRVTTFTLEFLTQDEAFSNAFEIDRRAGVDKEVMWIQDPDDTSNAIRRRFLGRFRQLNPIQYPYPNTATKAYEIKELL